MTCNFVKRLPRDKVKICGTELHSVKDVESKSSRVLGEKQTLEGTLEEEVCQEKALQVAMLKKRFAITILKAEETMLHDHIGNQADPMEVEREKKRLKRRQQEGRVRTRGCC